MAETVQLGFLPTYFSNSMIFAEGKSVVNSPIFPLANISCKKVVKNKAQPSRAGPGAPDVFSYSGPGYRKLDFDTPKPNFDIYNMQQILIEKHITNLFYAFIPLQPKR
jgi:hypothetical protein